MCPTWVDSSGPLPVQIYEELRAKEGEPKIDSNTSMIRKDMWCLNEVAPPISYIGIQAPRKQSAKRFETKPFAWGHKAF